MTIHKPGPDLHFPDILGTLTGVWTAWCAQPVSDEDGEMQNECEVYREVFVGEEEQAIAILVGVGWAHHDGTRWMCPSCLVALEEKAVAS